jgi:hypothetical protein
MRERIQERMLHSENIKLIQIRVGILFPLFLIIALKARRRNAGLHKRMMILATAIPLPAGIDRIPWLPTTLPGSPCRPIFTPWPPCCRCLRGTSCAIGPFIRLTSSGLPSACH